MTKRERVLGIIFLGCLLAGAALFGAQLYFEKLGELDIKITRSESRKARLELEMRSVSSGAVRRKAWPAGDAAPEAFLSRFDRVARSALWSTESTVFKGRKEGLARFSIGLIGPSNSLGKLLSAFSSWDTEVHIESIEAQASGKGAMRATIEAGYALK